MHAICVACGTQFRETAEWPKQCPICEDERQYVGLDGQRWTTLPDLHKDHTNKIAAEEAGLTAFFIEPKFGIGQRALLLQTPAGNVLWDCLSLLDEAAITYIKSVGGLAAIAISHPHYYTCMVEWSRVFGGVPIYLHQDDAKWVMRPDPRIHFWQGERQQLPGNLTLIRCGGHFAGGCVLHWPGGNQGKGALLTGDIIQVVPDRRWVSFMYSYPNYIPLNAVAVKRILAAVEPFSFDRIYGAFEQMTVQCEAKSVLERSVERYLIAIATGV